MVKWHSWNVIGGMVLMKCFSNALFKTNILANSLTYGIACTHLDDTKVPFDTLCLEVGYSSQTFVSKILLGQAGWGLVLVA